MNAKNLFAPEIGVKIRHNWMMFLVLEKKRPYNTCEGCDAMYYHDLCSRINCYGHQRAGKKSIKLKAVEYVNKR